MLCIFLYIASIYSREVQICICQNLKCEQYAGCSEKNTLDPVNELTSKDFYDRIQILMIGCDEVNLVIRRSTGSFVPELRLIQFSGKSLKVTESCLNNAPREGLKFQYADNEDYSRISLVSLSAKIIFTPIDNKNKKLELANFILSDTSYSSVEFDSQAPEVSSNTITKADSSLILSKFLIFNQILVNSSGVDLYIDNEQCEIKLHENNYFEYSLNSNLKTNVYYPSDSPLKFNRVGEDPGIMFINNVDINDYTKIPKFTTTNVDEIGISGTWPDPPSTEFNRLISIGDDKTDTKISVISEKVPFNFYGRNLELTIIKSTTFVGQIESRSLTIKRTTDEKATVLIPKLTSDLKIISPNVDITVDDYTYTGYGIPTTVSFSANHMSKLTVNKFTRMNTIDEYILNVFSSLTSEVSSAKIISLFTNHKDFLILPYEEWTDSSDIIIQYDSSSSERDGFTNQYNIIKVVVTKEENKAIFSFNLETDPPSTAVERNVCYDSDGCSGSNPIIGSEVDVSQYLTDQTDYVFTIYKSSFSSPVKFNFNSISSGEYNFIFRVSSLGNYYAIDIQSSEQSLNHIKSITLKGDLRILTTSKIYANTLKIMEQTFFVSYPSNSVVQAANIEVESTVDFSAYLTNIASSSSVQNIVINAEKEDSYTITAKDSAVSFNLEKTNVDLPFKNSYKISFLTSNLVIESAIESTLSGTFSVDFTQNSQITLNKFTKEISSNSKIQLNHDNFELTINYDIGTKFSNYFQLNGHGYVSQNINYGTFTEYCLCYAEGDAKCSNCNDKTQLYYDSFASSIGENVHYAKIIVQPPSSGNAVPVVPVSLFNNRKIEIESTEENTALTLKLEDGVTISSSNVKFKGTFNLQSDSTSSTSKEISFDVLDIESLEGTINNFNNIKLTANILYCSLSQINQFSEFNILNEIKVDVGTQDTNPSFEKNVHIDAGSDFYDLTINFQYNINPFTFTFGEGYMQLGNVKFIIEKTEYVDIVVNTPRQNFNFNINLAKNVDINKVPLAKFDMNTEGGVTRNVYFDENWREANNQILTFVIAQTVSFYFKSLVPMGIEMNRFVIHNFYVDNSNLQNVGIQFGFTIDQNIGTNVNTYTDGWKIQASSELESSKTFCINLPIRFLHRCENFQLVSESPKVSLLINNILSTDSSILNINIKLPLDATTASSLTFESTLSNIIKEVLIEASIDNTVDIESINLLNRNITIVNGRYANLISMINDNIIKYTNIAQNPAYGTSTTSDVIGFTLSQNQRSINLGRIKQLSESTFVAQYERNQNTEIINDVSLVISDPRNIAPILSASLPKQVKSVYLYITDNLYETDIIDFRQFSTTKFENKIDFVLDGVSLKRYTAPIILGPIINTLTLANLNLLVPNLPPESSMIIKEDKINIDLIKFTDSSVPAKSLNIDGSVKRIETDTDTFNSLLNNNIIQDTYQGKLKLTSSNYITFTKDGWIVQESSWKTPVSISSKSSLSNRIQFEANDEVSLLLDPNSEETMTEVVKPDLSVISTKGDDKVTVHIGTGWRQITNAKDLNINANNNQLDIYTASYPFDNMFNTNNISVSLGTNNGQAGSGNNEVDFNLGDEYVLNNVQNLDMTSIQNENSRIIHANLIRCSGLNSQISFVKDMGQVRINQLVVEDGSYAQLPKTTVSNTIEMIESSILLIDLLNQPNQGIDFKWRYNKMPEMTILSKDTVSYKPSITVTFNSDENEENINKTYYNDLLVNMRFNLITGNFKCEEWKNNAKFSASVEKFSSNSGENCTFEFQCIKSRNLDVLQVRTVNLFDLPKPPEEGDDKNDNDNTDKDIVPTPKNTLSTGAIVGIALACAVFAAAICGLVVFILIRRKYEKAMENDNIELAEGINNVSVSSTNN